MKNGRPVKTTILCLILEALFGNHAAIIGPCVTDHAVHKIQDHALDQTTIEFHEIEGAAALPLEYEDLQGPPSRNASG